MEKHDNFQLTKASDQITDNMSSDSFSDEEVEIGTGLFIECVNAWLDKNAHNSFAQALLEKHHQKKNPGSQQKKRKVEDEKKM